jgi:hypothetical protein
VGHRRGEADYGGGVVSLDVYLTAVRPTEVFSANITHNLNAMAEAAGIYKELWRPDEIGVTTAAQLIAPLREGLVRLRSDPEKFIALEPENKWGTYAAFVPWVERYLAACEGYPDAEVQVSR